LIEINKKMKSKNSNKMGSFFQSKYLSSLKKIAKTFVRIKYDWTIGIYAGESPFELSSPENIKNPVLTAKDVTDVSAEFVADPFMVYENGTWYMFFEVLNRLKDQGEIGLATSKSGLNWHYQQIVISEDFHLSYPYVFKFKNEYYMIPESYQANSIRLYKAVEFPTQWTFVKTLLDGGDYVDSSILNFQDHWWIFTTSPKGNILHLYYADELMGNWIKHPQSPLIEGNFHISRPGGRVIVYDGKIFRYTQDVAGFYGNKVRAYEITNLTNTDYEEKAIIDNPIIKGSGYGWNKTGMHTIDPHQLNDSKWIACVDGSRLIVMFGREQQKRTRLMAKADATK
jgi:hypothetical protein